LVVIARDNFLKKLVIQKESPFHNNQFSILSVISFFLLSFSLDEKETKNQGKKMLQRTRPRLARYFADPTRIVNGKIEI